MVSNWVNEEETEYVFKGEDLPARFCEKCGKKLKIYADGDAIKYDRFTGEPYHRTLARCSDWALVTSGHNSSQNGHTRIFFLLRKPNPIGEVVR